MYHTRSFFRKLDGEGVIFNFEEEDWAAGVSGEDVKSSLFIGEL